ncbi:MAG: PEGA domain-containing protein [candidate division Zixibacteria bacterium]|nr:PEGA domain-containing protein [candidate division Zixibacteria bacterium]
MLLKRILTACLLFVLLPVILNAQGTALGNFTVKSSPAGAEVTLKGEAVVVGITPTVFQQPLFGEYRVDVKRFGFEKYSTRVMLDPSKPQELTVTLTPKTRIKAAVRSLVVPGWGQLYAEQRTKSFFFNLLAVGSVAAYLIADNDYNDKYDDLTASERAYDSTIIHGGSYADIRTSYLNLRDNREEAYDAETIRRITIGAVIGAWSLSVLDALFFFPQESGTFSVKGLALKPETGSGTIGLTLTKSF